MTKKAGSKHRFDDFAELTAIGLTKTQSRCYSLLNSNYGMSAAEIAKRLAVSRTNLYPLLNDLRDKGFITEQRILPPNIYRAVPLLTALANYADYQRQQVRSLIIEQARLTGKP